MKSNAPSGSDPDPQHTERGSVWSREAPPQTAASASSAEHAHAYPEYTGDVAGPFDNAPVLQAWKTSLVFSLLGLLAHAFLLAFVASGAPLLAFAAAALMPLYALAVFPSYFSNKPRLRSNKAISFANLMFGGPLFGSQWNRNLGTRTKGVSHVIYAVAIALICLSLVSGMNTLQRPSTGASAPDYRPTLPNAPSPSPTPLWVSTSIDVEPLKHAKSAQVYTDAEAGASFVWPSSWSEVPLAVSQGVEKAKFRAPESGSTVYYESRDGRGQNMDDNSESSLTELVKKSRPNSTVQRTLLNGVEYFAVSARWTDPRAGVDLTSVGLIRVEKGRMYAFEYVDTGSNEYKNLQTFYSMVASMAYPK